MGAAGATPEVLRILTTLAADKNDWVRRYASQALDKLGLLQ